MTSLYQYVFDRSGSQNRTDTPKHERQRSISTFLGLKSKKAETGGVAVWQLALLLLPWFPVWGRRGCFLPPVSAIFRKKRNPSKTNTTVFLRSTSVCKSPAQIPAEDPAKDPDISIGPNAQVQYPRLELIPKPTSYQTHCPLELARRLCVAH